jgi:hypothetical protein
MTVSEDGIFGRSLSGTSARFFCRDFFVTIFQGYAVWDFQLLR